MNTVKGVTFPSGGSPVFSGPVFARGTMFDTVKHWFSSHHAGHALAERLEKLRQRVPVPLFWLFGKTQTGKTSIISRR